MYIIKTLENANEMIDATIKICNLDNLNQVFLPASSCLTILTNLPIPTLPFEKKEDKTDIEKLDNLLNIKQKMGREGVDTTGILKAINDLTKKVWG